jgi:hypothetical protein
MAIKKFVAVRLGVIYNSHATNKKQEGPPVRALPSLPESHMTPGRPECTNNRHKQVEAFTFLSKNRLKQHFLHKPFNKT